MQHLFPLSFPEKDKLFLWFDKYLDEQTLYYPLVSGGPDSMFMMHVLFDYFFTKGRDVSSIYPLHINHKQRESSDEEELFLRNYFSLYNIIIHNLPSIKGQKMTENMMRKARWELVEKSMETHGLGVVLTGHHLSDRVETSFLHLMRGCKLPGIGNMSSVDSKVLSSIACRVLRPLLSLPKESIRALCEQYTIPFFDDPSNDDVTISQRNKIRKHIQIFLSLYSSHEIDISDIFREQLDKVYSHIEENLPLSSCFLCKLKPSIHRGVQSYYQTLLPQTSSEVYTLFASLGALGGISEKILDAYAHFFSTKSTGWKWWQGWYFVIAHSKLYCLGKPFTGDFWTGDPSSQTLAITALGSYTLGDFTRDIIDTDYIGGVMRYPQSGDSWKGKKLAKYLLNKKIPVLRRKYYPIIEKNGRIVAVLDPRHILCGM